MSRRKMTALYGPLAAGLILGLTAGNARAQEVREECRCVDSNGQEIENCRCFRSPDFRGLAYSFRSHPRARIGVAVDPMQDDERDRQGAYLVEVTPASPADEAGLREGDVVTRVAGRSVLEPLDDADEERSLDEARSLPVQRFTTLVGDLDPDQEVEIEYLRDGRTERAKVTPEEASGFFVRGPNFVLRQDSLGDLRHPFARLHELGEGRWFAPGGNEARVWSFGDEGEGVRVLTRAFDPCLASGRTSDVNLWVVSGGDRCVDGLHLQGLNPQLAEYFAVEEGVLVTEVADEAALGLQAGDVIVAIDGRAVEEPGDVRRILGSYEDDEPVAITVVRKGEEMQVRGTRR